MAERPLTPPACTAGVAANRKLLWAPYVAHTHLSKFVVEVVSADHTLHVRSVHPEVLEGPNWHAIEARKGNGARHNEARVGTMDNSAGDTCSVESEGVVVQPEGGVDTVAVVVILRPAAVRLG